MALLFLVAIGLMAYVYYVGKDAFDSLWFMVLNYRKMLRQGRTRDQIINVQVQLISDQLWAAKVTDDDRNQVLSTYTRYLNLVADEIDRTPTKPFNASLIALHAMLKNRTP